MFLWSVLHGFVCMCLSTYVCVWSLLGQPEFCCLVLYSYVRSFSFVHRPGLESVEQPGHRGRSTAVPHKYDASAAVVSSRYSTSHPLWPWSCFLVGRLPSLILIWTKKPPRPYPPPVPPRPKQNNKMYAHERENNSHSPVFRPCAPPPRARKNITVYRPSIYYHLACVQDVQAHPVHDGSRLSLQRKGRVVPPVRRELVRLPRGHEVPIVVVGGG